MLKNNLCISIPDELQQYTKVNSLSPENIEDKNVMPNFGVKVIKDENGNILYTAYFSDIGDLIKKIYYKGSAVSCIEHYRNNVLYSQEKYNEGRICKKNVFNRQGKSIYTIKYEYNKKEQIIAIRKNADNIRYDIEYGYDALMRVDSRKIKINNVIVAEQRFRYDILDRIVEYHDKNQTIKVHKINPKNELISYTITDKSGNIISILNKFMCSDYLGTEIELNGHKTTIKDYSYVDNVMLKRPFTSEDDLDFIVTSIFKQTDNGEFCKTTRQRNTDITSLIIDDTVKNAQKPLPISVRKRLLLAQN